MEHEQDKSNEEQTGQLRQAGVTRRVFAFSGGEQEVCIGDVYEWRGCDPGRYTVIGWAGGRIYSPSGLGGTSTVIVEDERGVKHEWCGDSVARGVRYGRVLHGG